AIGHSFDAESPLADSSEIESQRPRHFKLLCTQGTVQVDHEVEQIEVVLQEKIVAQIFEILRSQRIQRNVCLGNVAGDEIEYFAADVEMTQDQPVRLRSHERVQAPRQKAMQQPRGRECIG